MVVFSLLMKVCHSLKNRSRDVRDVARETLVKMATILGPRYLQYVIKEMKELLTRGYQVTTIRPETLLELLCCDPCHVTHVR